MPLACQEPGIKAQELTYSNKRFNIVEKNTKNTVFCPSWPCLGDLREPKGCSFPGLPALILNHLIEYVST